jgi:hypothetical protein
MPRVRWLLYSQAFYLSMACACSVAWMAEGLTMKEFYFVVTITAAHHRSTPTRTRTHLRLRTHRPRH